MSVVKRRIKKRKSRNQVFYVLKLHLLFLFAVLLFFGETIKTKEKMDFLPSFLSFRMVHISYVIPAFRHYCCIPLARLVEWRYFPRKWLTCGNLSQPTSFNLHQNFRFPIFFNFLYPSQPMIEME